MNAEEHYNDRYFESQSRFDEIQGEANLFKFSRYIGPNDRVLDFGCGSGALLHAIGSRGGSIAGVEVNSTAAAFARKRGIEVATDLQEIESESIDVFISHHALEHVENPLHVMREAYRVLRAGGTIVVVVPCDAASFKWTEEDFDMHLFSWSANNIGNLLKVAGLNVVKCEELLHRWPPRWHSIQRHFGWRTFHVASAVWGRVDRRRSQVRAVASKPKDPIK